LVFARPTRIGKISRSRRGSTDLRPSRQ
jgi:hypothetical protein